MGSVRACNQGPFCNGSDTSARLHCTHLYTSVHAVGHGLLSSLHQWTFFFPLKLYTSNTRIVESSRERSMPFDPARPCGFDGILGGSKDRMTCVVRSTGQLLLFWCGQEVHASRYLLNSWTDTDLR